MRGSTKVIPPILFLRNICHGYILYRVEVNLPQSLVCYQHTFSTFAWDIVFQLVGVHPSGGQKDGSWRVLNWDCRENEGKQSTPLLQLTPLCTDWFAVWCCHAGRVPDSSSCLAEPFEFVIFNLFNCAAHSSLVMMQRSSWRNASTLSFVSVITAVVGRPLQGLSPMSLSPLLKQRV